MIYMISLFLSVTALGVSLICLSKVAESRDKSCVKHPFDNDSYWDDSDDVEFSDLESPYACDKYDFI